MRQSILRLVCDDCGLIACFETMNSEPLTVTTEIQGMVDKQGWHSQPKENSRFSTYDLCPSCKQRKWPS